MPSREPLILELTCLPAGTGDSIHIRYVGESGKARNVFVDGGNTRSDYNRGLKRRVRERLQAREQIDLLVATHDDDDHLMGLKWLLQDLEDGTIPGGTLDSIAACFFHSPKVLAQLARDKSARTPLSPRTAGAVASHLAAPNYAQPQQIPPWTFALDGATITVLSPDPPTLERYARSVAREYGRTALSASSEHPQGLDELRRLASMPGSRAPSTSLANQSSLAFILSIGERRILISSDASPRVLSRSIAATCASGSPRHRTALDCVVLPHHGSKSNMTLELARQLDCRSFMISGGSSGHHNPSKVAIATLLEGLPSGQQISLGCNSKESLQRLGISEDEARKHGITILPPDDDAGLSISWGYRINKEGGK